MRRTLSLLPATVLAAGAILFLALPLVGLLARAPWDRAGEVLLTESTQVALRLSLFVSIAATSCALLLGFPIAWLLARSAIPGRGLLRALVALPLVLPPVVAGVGLLAALGRRGLVGAWLAPFGVTLPFTTAGVIVAACFVSLPLLVLSLEAGLRSLDPRLEEAAASFGASRWMVFRRVMLPQLGPHLAAGLALTWARALGEFGATITFAGNLPGRTQTLPLAAYEALQSDTGTAILLSLILVGLSAVVLFVARDRLQAV